MKSGAKDKSEGRMHQAKGTIKEVAGKMVRDKDLEAEGKAEKSEGKVQEKIGRIKEVLSR